MRYQIIVGNAKEVEDKLNSKLTYRKKFGQIKVISMSATNEQTTVLISIE